MIKNIASLPMANDISADTLDVIRKLDLLLSKCGGYAKIVKAEKGFSQLLSISFDDEKAQNYLSRGAGRHAIVIEKEITVKEVRKLLEEKPSKEVAEYLGVSQSTLYRRLRSLGDEDFF